MIKEIALAAALVFAATGCASSPNIDETVSDIGADATLKGVLFADRSHDYGDVDLTIYEGRLMLTGTMNSEEGRRKLVENAWKAEGVEQVIDEILIDDGTRLGQGFEDARIDAALRARLIADDAVKSGGYKASVSKGVVYLLGVARSEGELNAALDVARSISGVEKVVSHVLVTP